MTLLNLSIFLSLVVATIATTNNNDNVCSKIATCKEIWRLTKPELDTYLRAVSKLSGDDDQINTNGQYTSVHYNESPLAHRVPPFFPWHCCFISNYELELQKVEPGVILTFWDWPKDTSNPLSSIVLTPEYFGGDWIESDKCITDGPLVTSTLIFQNHTV